MVQNCSVWFVLFHNGEGVGDDFFVDGRRLTVVGWRLSVIGCLLSVVGCWLIVIVFSFSFSFGLITHGFIFYWNSWIFDFKRNKRSRLAFLVGQIDSRELNEKNCSCTLFFIGIHESSISASLKQLFICFASSLRSGYALFDYLTLDCGL